jgi:uncharacterized secreted repeat protein (TIGR03808 family)
MTIDRRRLLMLGGAGAAAAVAGPAVAASSFPIGTLGLDAAHFGLRAGSPDDQSAVLQRAIAQAARARRPLAIAPGIYRVSNLRLPDGAQLAGIRGATRLVLGDSTPLLLAANAGHVTLTGLVLDGAWKPLPDRHGLLQFDDARSIRITDCEVMDAGGTAIACRAADGEIAGTRIADSAEAAIHSLDARGLTIARNVIVGAGNNGILVWRTRSGDDATLIADNRIESIANRSGGSGQYGNGINVFRAANVIVRGNRVRNCAFSAVRGNAASNIQIVGNAVSDVREVALYAEFEFEGAVIDGNTVDHAAIGVAVTNFNRGGRLAVVQGNIIRSLLPRRPAGTDPGDGAGIGIAVEADTTVLGNVVEDAPYAGIMLGWGRHLRDVAATGNIVRRTDIGIGVSVAAGAGTAVIANNVIAEFGRGAILGMDRRKIVAGDLIDSGAERYANLTVAGNRTR